jgi:hypothetical protein
VHLYASFLLLTLVSASCLAGPEGTRAAADHDFARWEPQISAFERMDQSHPPPAHALLFIGSSTIRMWSTLAADFPGHAVINRGFDGSEIVDSTHFCDRIVVPYKPRMIFFRAGGNDLWRGKSAERVFADYRDFVAAVHAQLPDTEIVWIAWSPTPSRWQQADKEKQLNELVKAFSRSDPRLGYVETYDMVLDAQGQPRPELFRSFSWKTSCISMPKVISCWPSGCVRICRSRR